jgi:hypothetical protein
MNYAYFMYTSLCDWTNTCRLNWTDFLSILSVQLRGGKGGIFLSRFSLQSAVSLNKVTGHSAD